MQQDHLVYTVPCSIFIEQTTALNSSFDKGVMRICYKDANRNRSFISKDVIEKAIPSMFNCPVVCRYDRDENDLGGHDVDFLPQEDGSIKMVHLTHPVGVVPESANTWWEEKEDSSGVHEYLCVDVIIWKRSEAYQKIKENKTTAQSMEIRVIDGATEKNFYVVHNFEFLAFCLLGENETPCFESASLEMFSEKNFTTAYSKMLDDFKFEFSALEKEISAQKTKKGGETMNEKIKELLNKYALEESDINFDYSSLSDEEVEEKFSAVRAAKDATAFALAGQLRDALVEALCVETISTEWGEMFRYSYIDHDPDLSVVYCYDTDDWKIYGFTYMTSGDSVTIDFESKKRKKIAFVDFEDGTADTDYGRTFTSVVQACNRTTDEKIAAIQAEADTKYQLAEATIREQGAALSELQEYKIQIEASIRTAAEDEVFSRFTDLNGIDVFEQLRSNCSEMSIEDIEEKCFAIRGRNTVKNFTMDKGEAPRLPIEKNVYKDEPYGGVFLEFGAKDR